MPVVSDDIEPLTVIFLDDGLVPNNPMPFLVYKAAVDVATDHNRSDFGRQVCGKGGLCRANKRSGQTYSPSGEGNVSGCRPFPPRTRHDRTIVFAAPTNSLVQ